MRRDDIEFDDGAWEIDDAVAADGKNTILKLNQSTLAIIAREEDGLAAGTGSVRQ
jgi:hypothetical protein